MLEGMYDCEKWYMMISWMQLLLQLFLFTLVSLSSLQAYKGNKVVRFLGELLIGPLRPEGRWQTLKSPDSRFLRKYGVLFEDNRGPPMVVRGATWAVDPVTGYVNRGRLEYHLGRPLLSFR